MPGKIRLKERKEGRERNGGTNNAYFLVGALYCRIPIALPR